jgi:hypothetical protein
LLLALLYLLRINICDHLEEGFFHIRGIECTSFDEGNT